MRDLRDCLLGQSVGELVWFVPTGDGRKREHDQSHPSACRSAPRFVRAWYRTDKPVASSRKRFDVSRRVGGVTQRAAQPSHGRIDAVLEVHERVRGPEPRSEFFATQYFARSLQQTFQKAEGLAL
jgi:hypothetical protein